MGSHLLSIVVGFFLLLLFLSAGVYVVGLYNRLVRVDERVDNAWADIDVLLVQRRDALEKLVDALQQAMEYESDLLTDVVEARELAQQTDSPEAAAKATAAVREALSGISIRAEDHPDASAVRKRAVAAEGNRDDRGADRRPARGVQRSGHDAQPADSPGSHRVHRLAARIHGAGTVRPAGGADG